MAVLDLLHSVCGDVPSAEHQQQQRVWPKACVCRHVKQAHEHYRRGTDCALCDCPRYTDPL
jgi:hypothetical protein